MVCEIIDEIPKTILNYLLKNTQYHRAININKIIYYL